MSNVLCTIFGHIDTNATWDPDKPFETRVYCRRCGWRTRVGDPMLTSIRPDKNLRDELKSCLLLAGLALLIGLALWRWIYVLKRLDLQF